MKKDNNCRSRIRDEDQLTLGAIKALKRDM